MPQKLIDGNESLGESVAIDGTFYSADTPGMPQRIRLEPKQSKDEILAAAGRVSLRDGFHRLTIAATATEAARAASLVSHYFKTLDGLKKAVMREAIKHGQAEIVADGLALRDPTASNAPPELIAKARAILATR